MKAAKEKGADVGEKLAKDFAGPGLGKPLTKKEKSEARKEDNKLWKQSVRKLGSGNLIEIDKEGHLRDPNPRHSYYYLTQLAVLWGRSQIGSETEILVAIRNEDEEDENAKSDGEDDSWALFQRCLGRPMPVTFRPGAACPAFIREYMARLMAPAGTFATMKGRFVEVDGKVLKTDIVRELKWFSAAASNHNHTPRNTGTHPVVYQCAVDSVTLSHNAGLAPLSAFLQREVRLGHVVRQELASMLPACLLDVQPHHIVLDVCAAPGSKTEQIAHAMTTLAGGGVPSGFLVANDADTKRIHTLRERLCERSGVPHLMLVNHRAEDLQKILAAHKRQCIRQMRIGTASSGGGGAMTASQALHAVGGIGYFDRIVADVPCSGDGTIRKFPHIWRLFRPRVSLELHSIQLQIATAAVLMLKPGGRMVYSTCSLNPLEDEAVVCALLRYFNIRGGCHAVKSDSPVGGGVRLYQTQYGGKSSISSDKAASFKNYSLRLVNAVPTDLPSIRAREGLDTWRCDADVFVDRRAESSDADYAQSLAMLPKIRSSMHPPRDETERRNMHLQYCRRILPQEMDCGGFFVAVLELVEIGSASTDGYGTPREGDEPYEAVSGLSSVHVMAKLGYNPTVAGVGSTAASAASMGGTGAGVNRGKSAGSNSKSEQKGEKRNRAAAAPAAAGDSNREGERDGEGAGAGGSVPHKTFRPVDPEQCQSLEKQLQLDIGRSAARLVRVTGAGEADTDGVRYGRQASSSAGGGRGKGKDKGKDDDAEKQSKKARPAPGCIFGSRSQGWAMQPDTGADDEDEEQEEEQDLVGSTDGYSSKSASASASDKQVLNLVSVAMHTALQTWARPAHGPLSDSVESLGTSGASGGGGTDNRESVHVIYAGVRLASLAPAPWSRTQEVRLDAGAVRHVHALLTAAAEPDRRSASGDAATSSMDKLAAIIQLSSADFKAIARLGCHSSNSTPRGSAAASEDADGSEGNQAAAAAEAAAEEAARNARLQAALGAIGVEGADGRDDEEESEGSSGGSNMATKGFLSAAGKRDIREGLSNMLQNSTAKPTPTTISSRPDAYAHKQTHYSHRLRYLFFELRNKPSEGCAAGSAAATHFSDEGGSSGSGRRLSKAEKKRLKTNSGQPPSSASASASASASLTDMQHSRKVQSGSGSGAAVDSWAGGSTVLAVTVVAPSEDGKGGSSTGVKVTLTWLSDADMCQSLASALALQS